MRRHIKISASSCTDMIDAFQAKIQELDPNYVGGATAIKAGEACPNCGSKNCDGSCVEASCPCGDPNCDGSCGSIPVEGASEFGTVDDSYIDDMMQYVADETVMPPYNAVCTWDINDDNVTFILTGMQDDSISEYTCPKEDLTGDVDADIQYILNSIN